MGVSSKYEDYWKKFKKSTSKYKSKLGWGSELSKTTSSSYYGGYYGGYYSGSYYGGGYYGYSSKEISEASDILSKAVKTTRDLVVILDFPFKLNILLKIEDSGDEDCSSGIYKNGTSRALFIPTKVVDKEDIDVDEKINIMAGLGIHEAMHLMYTSISVIRSFKENNSMKYPTVFCFLLNIFANLIEDERVEDLLLRERPGFSDFMEKAKNYKVNEYKKLRAVGNTNPVVDIVIDLIRFNGSLSSDENLEKYKDLVNKIQDLIPNQVQTTKESCLKAIDILETIKNNISKEEIEDLKKLNCDSYKTLYGEVFSGEDGEDMELMEKRRKEISKMVKESNILSKLVLGKAERGDDDETYFTKITGNSDSYLEEKKKIEHIIPSIKKIINQTDKNYEFNIYGCRSGVLDTNKLAEAYQGVPQVYMRKGEVRTNKTTLCVLIDESGSMWREDKYIRARRAAILLNEALGNLPGIDMYIYGHSADIVNSGSTDINIYKEGSKFSPKHSLSNVYPRDENRDGTAILEVAKRVRKFTNDHCLMFILSDGTPWANNYYGEEAEIDTRDKVKKVESMDFDVVQISIDYVDGVDRMFTKYIDISKDLAELPNKLGKIIKKSIIDNKKTEIV